MSVPPSLFHRRRAFVAALQLPTSPPFAVARAGEAGVCARSRRGLRPPFFFPFPGPRPESSPRAVDRPSLPARLGSASSRSPSSLSLVPASLRGSSVALPNARRRRPKDRRHPAWPHRHCRPPPEAASRRRTSSSGPGTEVASTWKPRRIGRQRRLGRLIRRLTAASRKGRLALAAGGGEGELIPRLGSGRGRATTAGGGGQSRRHADVAAREESEGCSGLAEPVRCCDAHAVTRDPMVTGGARTAALCGGGSGDTARRQRRRPTALGQPGGGQGDPRKTKPYHPRISNYIVFKSHTSCYPLLLSYPSLFACSIYHYLFILLGIFKNWIL